MHYLLFILTLWFVPTVIQAQQLLEARKQVDSLHTFGAAVVLLKGTSKSLAAYDSAGNKKVAAEIRKKNRKLNLSIIKSFNTHWTFSPVYFLMNDKLHQFLANPYSSVLVDTLLNPTDIKLTQPYYVFIDFGPYYIPSDNGSDRSPGKWKRDSTNIITMDPVESNQVIEETLIIKDKSMHQFLPPYPSRSASIMGSRDMHKLVSILNDKLFKFIATQN